MKKKSVFQKSYIKVEGYKTFKFSSDCHIKRCQSLKERAILKNWSVFFQRTLCSIIQFLKETSTKKRFQMIRQKLCGTCSNFFQSRNYLFLSPCLNICTQWNYKCLDVSTNRRSQDPFFLRSFVLKCFSSFFSKCIVEAS